MWIFARNRTIQKRCVRFVLDDYVRFILDDYVRFVLDDYVRFVLDDYVRFVLDDYVRFVLDDYVRFVVDDYVRFVLDDYVRFALDDYVSDYGNLIKKNGTTTLEIKRLRTLATEIFKASNINLSHVKNIFTPQTNANIRPHDILVRHHNTANYGDKSLTALGPKIWNKLPTNIKSVTSITKFKEYIRT